MPFQILVATGNRNKLQEIRQVLRLPGVEWLGLDILDQGVWEPPEETADTFLGNALIKARAGARASGLACLADDSGLVVPALGDRPGVYSSRFAGPDATDAENNAALLEAMAGMEDRFARFECVLVLVDRRGEILAECLGTVEGMILEGSSRGRQGFGYDPLFVPEGHNRTFAELGPETKNRISHRARALHLLRARLEERGNL